MFSRTHVSLRRKPYVSMMSWLLHTRAGRWWATAEMRQCSCGVGRSGVDDRCPSGRVDLRVQQRKGLATQHLAERPARQARHRVQRHRHRGGRQRLVEVRLKRGLEHRPRGRAFAQLAQQHGALRTWARAAPHRPQQPFPRSPVPRPPRLPGTRWCHRAPARHRAAHAAPRAAPRHRSPAAPRRRRACPRSRAVRHTARAAPSARSGPPTRRVSARGASHRTRA